MHGRKGGLVRDLIADSESFRSASQGGRLQSEWVADFRRNRWPDCVGISGRLPPDYALMPAMTTYARYPAVYVQLARRTLAKVLSKPVLGARDIVNAHQTSQVSNMSSLHLAAK